MLIVNNVNSHSHNVLLHSHWKPKYVYSYCHIKTQVSSE